MKIQYSIDKSLYGEDNDDVDDADDGRDGQSLRPDPEVRAEGLVRGGAASADGFLLRHLLAHQQRSSPAATQSKV